MKNLAIIINVILLVVVINPAKWECYV